MLPSDFVLVFIFWVDNSAIMNHIKVILYGFRLKAGVVEFWSLQVLAMTMITVMWVRNWLICFCFNRSFFMMFYWKLFLYWNKDKVDYLAKDTVYWQIRLFDDFLSTVWKLVYFNNVLTEIEFLNTIQDWVSINKSGILTMWIKIIIYHVSRALFGFERVDRFRW
jgi:hypothetical protein